MSDVLGKDRELAERIRETREAAHKAVDDARKAGLQVSAFVTKFGSNEEGIITVLISRDGIVL